MKVPDVPSSQQICVLLLRGRGKGSQLRLIGAIVLNGVDLYIFVIPMCVNVEVECNQIL